MAEFTYDVKETFGKLVEGPNGWAKEVKLISWAGRDPKYDIRDSSPDGTQMNKGLTFTKDEITALRDLLNSIEL